MADAITTDVFIRSTAKETKILDRRAQCIEDAEVILATDTFRGQAIDVGSLHTAAAAAELPTQVVAANYRNVRILYDSSLSILYVRRIVSKLSRDWSRC